MEWAAVHPGGGAILAVPYNFFENAGQSQAFPVNHVYEMEVNGSRILDQGRALETTC